jgi:hypothetical protein
MVKSSGTSRSAAAAVMELLGLAEVEHNAKNNRIRAK